MANKRLLIIEDDFDVAEMLLMYFQTHEFEVMHAEHGLAGIELARTRFPNLILLDVMLPHMDGYDVCARLRQMAMTKYIPIIFLTQRDERSSKVKGLELGADDYITKPFDVDELRLRVQRAIRVATTESLSEARTGLPTGPLVADELHKRQVADRPFVELRYSLDGFTTYHDVYGFMSSKDVLNRTGVLLQEATSRHGTTDDFVGIVNDDFIVLTHSTDVDTLDKLVKERFAEEIKAFYTFGDAERGGLLLDAGTEKETLAPLMKLVSTRVTAGAAS